LRALRRAKDQCGAEALRALHHVFENHTKSGIFGPVSITMTNPVIFELVFPKSLPTDISASLGRYWLSDAITLPSSGV